jgi:hypothetical protein
VLAYAVIDNALSPDFPLGDSLEVFIRREDAERFIKEVRGDAARPANTAAARALMPAMLRVCPVAGVAIPSRCLHPRQRRESVSRPSDA